MDFEKAKIFGLGNKNEAYARYFDGQSYLCPLGGKDSPLSMANVTFQPGCRNHWHIHHAKRGGDRSFWSRPGKATTRSGERSHGN